MSDDERLAYIALALAPGIGLIRLDNLRNALGSFSAALGLPSRALAAVPGMNRPAAAAVCAADRSGARRSLEHLERLGGFVLTPFDDDFPELLRHHKDPPILLFGLGRRDLLRRPAVAVVGSRHPTSYGIGVTRDVGARLASATLAVVSGMARGLDAVAHWAALEAGGDTIGVLGNGFDVIYPAANRALYQRVAAAGLLITEHPPGERPNAGSFQRRNRLISGVARATLVVEAAHNSGALKTAEFANDEGREVFAVPGQITSRTSVGTNRLLQRGTAAPFLEVDDILRVFPEIPPAARLLARGAAGRDLIDSRFSADVRRVYDALDSVPRTIDALVEELRIPPGDVIAAVSELELGGVVEGHADGFRRTP